MEFILRSNNRRHYWRSIWHARGSAQTGSQPKNLNEDVEKRRKGQFNAQSYYCSKQDTKDTRINVYIYIIRETNRTYNRITLKYIFINSLHSFEIYASLFINFPEFIFEYHIRR